MISSPVNSRGNEGPAVRGSRPSGEHFTRHSSHSRVCPGTKDTGVDPSPQSRTLLGSSLLFGNLTKDVNTENTSNIPRRISRGFQASLKPWIHFKNQLKTPILYIFNCHTFLSVESSVPWSPWFVTCQLHKMLVSSQGYGFKQCTH